MYYADKLATLQDLFGTTDISLEAGALRVGSTRYPITDDVIVLSQASHSVDPAALAEDIRFTFGEEWRTYDAILPEHRREFAAYFDLLDLTEVRQARVCDLGCGMGRWSHFAKDHCREIVLVDFSEAIFVARKNLVDAPNALFFMCDLKRLPFRENFADFLFCLGVLHHLPTPCLDEVHRLRTAAPRLLIYLYYALDKRPWYFRALLHAVTVLRHAVSRARHPLFRKLFSWGGTWLIYCPLIALGRLAQQFGRGRSVPLYEFYHDKSLRRIEQDVYDRFFTRIEQRVTREQILGLRSSFNRVTISNRPPYWHFLCER
jgi:SAM-dependent methyltransferase